MISGSNFRTGALCCWGRPTVCWWYAAAGDMCYSYAMPVWSRSAAGEVLIHAGIMHAGRLWHLSLLPCSQAHLFGNGFTYIFLQMTLPLPLPRLTAPAHTHTHTHTLAKLEATNTQLQQRASRWCNSPSVGHVGRYLAWAAMVVRAHYASIRWTLAPSVGFSARGI